MDCLLQFENILQKKRPQRNQKNNTSFPRSVCVSSLQTNSYSNSHSQSHLEGLSDSITITSKGQLCGIKLSPAVGCPKAGVNLVKSLEFFPGKLYKHWDHASRPGPSRGPTPRPHQTLGWHPALLQWRRKGGTRHHLPGHEDSGMQNGVSLWFTSFSFPWLCIRTTHVPSF